MLTFNITDKIYKIRDDSFLGRLTIGTTGNRSYTSCLAFERFSCSDLSNVYYYSLIFVLLLCILKYQTFDCCHTKSYNCYYSNPSFPIVEPDPHHTKLRLSKEGLEAIERIKGPIAAVAVSSLKRSFIFFFPPYLWFFYIFLKIILFLSNFSKLDICQVIGPYRSGKSFLLNQLLSLSCYEGPASAI